MFTIRYVRCRLGVTSIWIRSRDESQDLKEYMFLVVQNHAEVEHEYSLCLNNLLSYNNVSLHMGPVPSKYLRHMYVLNM